MPFPENILMASLRSRLIEGVHRLNKGRAESALEAFDFILAALGSPGPGGQLHPHLEVDERTCEIDTMEVRHLRLQALLACQRWPEAMREIESLYQYSLHFGSTDERVQLLQHKSQVAQRLGQ